MGMSTEICDEMHGYKHPGSDGSCCQPEQNAHESPKEHHEHTHENVHHHHLVIDGKSMLLPFILALVFSIHSFIEGLALGVKTELDAGALSIFIAIVSHKFVEAVTVGSNFVKEDVNLAKALPVLLVYCLMTPLGIVVGMIVTSTLESGGTSVVVQGIFQAFASGSFVYLAIHEINDDKSCHGVPAMYQVLLLTLGLGSMAVLSLWV